MSRLICSSDTDSPWNNSGGDCSLSYPTYVMYVKTWQLHTVVSKSNIGQIFRNTTHPLSRNTRVSSRSLGARRSHFSWWSHHAHHPCMALSTWGSRVSRHTWISRMSFISLFTWVSLDRISVLVNVWTDFVNSWKTDESLQSLISWQGSVVFKGGERDQLFWFLALVKLQ